MNDKFRAKFVRKRISPTETDLDLFPFQRDETTEDLRRQIRSLEEKLRKTKIAERPLEDARVSHEEIFNLICFVLFACV